MKRVCGNNCLETNPCLKNRTLSQTSKKSGGLTFLVKLDGGKRPIPKSRKVQAG